MIELQWNIVAQIKSQRNITLAQITDNIYLGDYGDSKDKEKLKSLKISHILACGKELKQFFPDDYKYKQIICDDIESANIKQYFDDNFIFVDDAINNNGVVFFHW